MARLDPAVRDAVNALTSRWVERVDDPGTGFVLSGLGVWPLLATLASGADGPALDELTDALAIDDDPANAARRLVVWAERSPDVSIAVAMWVRARVRMIEAWVDRQAPALVRTMPADDVEAKADMDAWAAAGTNGLIDAMPVDVDASTLAVLASALLTEFEWEEPFDRGVMHWNDEWVAALHRSFHDLDLASVVEAPAGPVGRFVARGEGGVDVHLLTAAEDVGAADVIAAGIAALGGDLVVTAGSTLPVGTVAGGLTVRREKSGRSGPDGIVTLPAFDVEATHDLGEIADVFGLESAFDTTGGHFARIAEHPPLAIDSGRQVIRAAFSDVGFRAAAVTAFAMMAGAAPGPPPESRKILSVLLDRPFGFLAVDRASGLVLVAGWVTEGLPDTDDLD